MSTDEKLDDKSHMYSAPGLYKSTMHSPPNSTATTTKSLTPMSAMSSGIQTSPMIENNINEGDSNDYTSPIGRNTINTHIESEMVTSEIASPTPQPRSNSAQIKPSTVYDADNNLHQQQEQLPVQRLTFAQR